MRVVYTDSLVIGGGLAGLRVAIASKNRGLDTLVLSLIPACLILPWERWDSAGAIAGVAAPLLVLHGEADAIIPFAQGRKLFEAAPGPKRLLAYPGRGHNDLAPAATARDAAAFLGDVLMR